MLYVDRYGLFGKSFFAGFQDFEWKSSFRDSSFYQSFESTAQNIWNSPRFQGSMQAIGGFAEAGFGAGMTYATGGLAAPAGCAVMAHGLDHFFTGMNSVITGRPAESVTSQLLQKAGMSPQNANLLDTGLSVAGVSCGMKLVQQGAGAFRASTANTGGKFIGAESINIARGEITSDWAQLSGMLRNASRGKGNFTVGSATREQASVMGRAWVGDGYKISSSGNAWISRDGLKQYRHPALKPNLGKTQANFQRRFEGQISKEWQSNAHLNILDVLE